MPNAFQNQPYQGGQTVYRQPRNALSQPVGMGGQSSGEAAEALRYIPIWKQELADGTTQLQFRDWLEQEYYPRMSSGVSG